MRRMITESDVEKLDSIQPSEIQKLGTITDADIESVKAMQSPKNATAGYVLTAVSGGTAEYKPAAGGAGLDYYTLGGEKEFFLPWFTSSPGYYPDRSKFPGYKIAMTAGDKALIPCFRSLPHYKKSDNSIVYLTPADYFMIRGEYGSWIFGLTQAAYDKFVADSEGVSNPAIESGMFAYYKLK